MFTAPFLLESAAVPEDVGQYLALLIRGVAPLLQDQLCISGLFGCLRGVSTPGVLWKLSLERGPGLIGCFRAGAIRTGPSASSAK